MEMGDGQDEIAFEPDQNALDNILSNTGISDCQLSNGLSNVNVGRPSMVYYQPPSHRMSMLAAEEQWKQKMKLLKQRLSLYKGPNAKTSLKNKPQKKQEEPSPWKKNPSSCIVYYCPSQSPQLNNISLKRNLRPVSSAIEAGSKDAVKTPLKSESQRAMSAHSTVQSSCVRKDFCSASSPCLCSKAFAQHTFVSNLSNSTLTPERGFMNADVQRKESTFDLVAKFRRKDSSLKSPLSSVSDIPLQSPLSAEKKKLVKTKAEPNPSCSNSEAVDYKENMHISPDNENTPVRPPPARCWFESTPQGTNIFMPITPTTHHAIKRDKVTNDWYEKGNQGYSPFPSRCHKFEEAHLLRPTRGLKAETPCSPYPSRGQKAKTPGKGPQRVLVSGSVPPPILGKNPALSSCLKKRPAGLFSHRDTPNSTRKTLQWADLKHSEEKDS